MHLANLSQISVNTFAGVGLSVVRVHLLLCASLKLLRGLTSERAVQNQNEQALTEYFTPSHSKKEAIKGLPCPL